MLAKVTTAWKRMVGFDTNSKKIYGTNEEMAGKEDKDIDVRNDSMKSFSGFFFTI